MIGPNVKQNYKSTTTYRHPNMLRTMLMAMGTTQNFPAASATAAPMSDMFVSSPSSPTQTGVSIATPVSGATVSTTMQVSASASGPHSITATQIYVDNALKASSNSNTINATIAVSAGPHSITAQSWDSTGTVTKRSVNVTAVNGATASGIVILTPTSGTMTASSVHVTATSNMANIVSTAVYVDNKLFQSTSSTSVDTYLTMTAGAHNLVVQNWDNKGSVTKSAVAFDSN